MDVDEGTAVVERECLLFEAGDYPDRGVTVTPEDLAAIARNSPAEVPVRVEHLRESPFDAALGVVTRLRVEGGRLWGTLRQPAEAWEFGRRAGARALSVALDLANRRLAEVSFVCRPRVAAARVFGEGPLLVVEAPPDPGKEEAMTNVRQFAEGLMGYLRGVLGGDDLPGDELARERARLAVEREALAAERADRQIAEFRRRGLLRGTERAEQIARALLGTGEAAVATFGGEPTPVGALFVRFVEENGPVAPMGEMLPADGGPAGAADRLMALAHDMARRESVPYVTAFSRVSRAHPDLARAAREEGLGG